MTIDFINQTDYIISSRKNLTTINSPQLIILTIFKQNIEKLSKQFPDKTVSKQDTYIPNSDIIIATPLHFLHNITKYIVNTKHILIYEPDLIADLDYLPVITALRNMEYYFVAYTSKASHFNYLINPEIISNSVKYFIRTTGNQDFYFIYYVLKMCLLDNSIAFVTTNKITFKRLQIFMKGLNLSYNCDLLLKNDDNTFVSDKLENICIDSMFYNNVIVVGDSLINFNCDRVIYLSSTELNVKEESFDFGKVEKYKYRIDDFLRGITKNVINGRKDFDYSRFKSMQKDI